MSLGSAAPEISVARGAKPPRSAAQMLGEARSAGSENAVSLPPGPSLYPAFSPDGLTLLYKQLDHNKWLLYAVSRAGGRTERILEVCDDYGWSSDGRRLVVAGPPPPGIDLLDLTSKRSTPLLRHARWSLWNPRFSPDDRWVAFNATEPGFSRIFVAPLRGGGLTPEAEWIAITPEKWADKPRWSPDGNFLYFISERDDFRCIWAQPLESRKHPTGRAIPVLHAHEARQSLANVGIGDLELSVARDKLVFNMKRADRESVDDEPTLRNAELVTSVSRGPQHAGPPHLSVIDNTTGPLR